MKKFIKKIIITLVNLWWVFWSNIRFKNDLKDNVLNKEDFIKNRKDLEKLVVRLYSKFTYTSDGLDQLGDAITPPPQNYQYYLEGEVKDDCDGFASLLCHCISKSGLENYLMTVSPEELTSGHCILILKLNDLWHVVDYRKVYNGFDTIEEAVKDYNEKYITLYNHKEVINNTLIKYSYEHKKFIYIKEIKV